MTRKRWGELLIPELVIDEFRRDPDHVYYEGRVCESCGRTGLSTWIWQEYDREAGELRPWWLCNSCFDGWALDVLEEQQSRYGAPREPR